MVCSRRKYKRELLTNGNIAYNNEYCLNFSQKNTGLHMVARLIDELSFFAHH